MVGFGERRICDPQGEEREYANRRPIAYNPCRIHPCVGPSVQRPHWSGSVRASVNVSITERSKNLSQWGTTVP